VGGRVNVSSVDSGIDCSELRGLIRGKLKGGEEQGHGAIIKVKGRGRQRRPGRNPYWAYYYNHIPGGNSAGTEKRGLGSWRANREKNRPKKKTRQGVMKLLTIGELKKRAAPEAGKHMRWREGA